MNSQIRQKLFSCHVYIFINIVNFPSDILTYLHIIQYLYIRGKFTTITVSMNETGCGLK